jgi:hypothetical protein
MSENGQKKVHIGSGEVRLARLFLACGGKLSDIDSWDLIQSVPERVGGDTAVCARRETVRH